MNNLTEFRPVTLPLSAKDVFSFLVPGATLIVLIYLYEFWSEKYFFATSESFRTPLYTALTSTATPDNWAYMLLYFLGVIALAYVTGHAVSWISVFFIDRIIVGRGHGYPYEHLLRIRKKPTRPTGRIGSFFYRGFFFWLNLYLMVMFVSIFKVFLPVDFWASVARFLGWTCVFIIVAKLVLSPLMVRFKPDLAVAFWKTLFLPYDRVTAALGRFTRSTEPFSRRFIRAYRIHLVRLFGMDPETAATGNRWWVEIYLRDKAPHLSVMIDYWYNLYSLSRNLSTACYLAFLYGSLSLGVQRGDLGALKVHERVILMTVIGSFFGAAFLFLSRYYYLFAQRHTRLLFRTFVYMCGGVVGEGGVLRDEERPTKARRRRRRKNGARHK